MLLNLYLPTFGDQGGGEGFSLYRILVLGNPMVEPIRVMGTYKYIFLYFIHKSVDIVL